MPHSQICSARGSSPLCASPRASRALRSVPPHAVTAYELTTLPSGHPAALPRGLGGSPKRRGVARHALGGLGLTSPGRMRCPSCASVPRTSQTCVCVYSQTEGGTHQASKARPRRASSIWRKAGRSAPPGQRSWRAPVRPLVGRGPRGLATRMAALCIAYAQLPLSPERVATLLVAIPTRPSPVTGWPPGRSTMPCEPACTIPPQAMLLALRRRLRLPLPLRCSRRGPPGCGREVDALGDHALPCTRTGCQAPAAIQLESSDWFRTRMMHHNCCVTSLPCSLKRMCRSPLSKALRWAASSPSANQAGAREAWWLATSGDGSLPGPLHNSSPPCGCNTCARRKVAKHLLQLQSWASKGSTCSAHCALR